MEKAFQQEAAGQHEAALRTIDAVVASHPTNPEALGRKAELLFRNGQHDEAEATLQKAFDINPQYPFGLLLQGLFRLAEGESTGALLLFRKAVDAYDPEARDQLGQLYGLIAEQEGRMNRPLALHAALKLALHFTPASDELRQALDSYFGDQSHLPPAARKDYTFLPPTAALTPERRTAWDQALARAATGKLSDAARAFAELAEADPQNAAAWFNLGLSRAWLGDNRTALEALDRYVQLEPVEPRAADAWALGQVLRQGRAMGNDADVIEHSAIYQIRDPQPVSQCFQSWQDQRRLLVIRAGENDPVTSMLILEKVTSLTADPSMAPLPHLAAYLVIMGDRLRVWHTNRESVAKVRDELRQATGPALMEGPTASEPANFNDFLAEALVFPVTITDKTEAEQRVRQQMEQFFEDKWIHQPLPSLGRVPPVDAAGHGTLRKKLRGVVQFLESIGQNSGQPYDFNRLRRKLGLLEGGAAPTATATAAAPDITSLGAAELAALQPESLGTEQLELAFQTSLKLDAKELAGRFGKALVARPPSGGKTDRYPVFNQLVQLAISGGDTAAALDTLNEGEKADCEQNEGRRRNDYELRRGQIHAKSGEAEAAQDVFDRLIQRVPTSLDYRTRAAEAMLSARQGARALKFAEGGLAEARSQKNRDAEGHFQELMAAAKKQQ
jgi:tetratricopeptide (TPR) repeat protein